MIQYSCCVISEHQNLSSGSLYQNNHCLHRHVNTMLDIEGSLGQVPVKIVCAPPLLLHPYQVTLVSQGHIQNYIG